jgi:hypothetical protein
VKVRLYFLLFENTLDQTKSDKALEKHSKNTFSKALINAFVNLSTAEKGHFLYNSMNFVIEQMAKK